MDREMRIKRRGLGKERRKSRWGTRKETKGERKQKNEGQEKG